MRRCITKPFVVSLAFIFTAALSYFPQTPVRTSNNKGSGELLTSKVDKIFSPWDKSNSPGCALAIVKNGKIIYARGYGMASLENNIPITPKSAFDIASTSKQFTAMAVLLLLQQGKISLDDDARKYIPELPDLGTPITVRQLIYHTNGLRDNYYLLELAGWRFDDEIREEDVLTLVSRTRELNHTPGEEHSYNNMGYSLMALLVERASGRSLRDFAEANIFKPLGMNDTLFRDDHTLVVKNRTSSYDPREGGGFSLSLGAVDTVGPNGVFTTVEDFARWDQNFYDKKVSGESGIREMTKPGALNDGTKIGYAFGLRVEDYKGLRMIWHSGAGVGTRTTYLLFPDQQFSVILFCNLTSMNMDALARQVADIYLANYFKQAQESGTTTQQAKPVEVPESDLANVAGFYFSSDYGIARRLYVKSGKLFYLRSVDNESELVPLGNDRFLMTGAPARTEVVFKPAQSALPQRIFLISGGGKPTVFEKVEFISYAPDQLNEFAGNYYSEELDATYTFNNVNGQLVLRRKKWPDIKLKSVFADAFNDDSLGVIRFLRGPRKQIVGLTLSNGNRGVRRLRFSRHSE